MLKIGLTVSAEKPNFYLRTRYVRTLMDTAARNNIAVLPILLPIVSNRAVVYAMAAECDGFLFTGGDDVDPSYYGEEMLPTCGMIEPERDAFELALLKAVFPTGRPIFGICRGCQIANVFCGGSLWQDMPTQLAKLYPNGTSHCTPDADGTPRHTVQLSGTLAALLARNEIETNSFHHQAIRQLGEGLRVCARSREGTVEAIEHESHPFFRAVQWHPEIEPDAHLEILFTDFLRAAGGENFIRL